MMSESSNSKKRKKKTLTTSAVAAALHLSQSTVSRALNPASAWMVSPETRRRVRTYCRERGVTTPSAVREHGERTFKVGLVLGSMQFDLGEMGDMIHHLCDLLQANNYALTLIRVDFSKSELVRNVKRIIKSNIADVYIVGAVLMGGQTLELLHSVCRRVILYIPMLSITTRESELRWLSSIRHVHEDSQLELLRKLPETWREDICFFGRDNLQSHAQIELLRRQGRACGSSMNRLSACLFGKCSIPPSVAYRTARQEAERHFPEIAGHQLYWSIGDPEGQALSDVFAEHGLRCGRDYRLVSYGGRAELADHEIASFCGNAKQEAKILCELVLSLLDDPVPRRIEIPLSFMPGKSLPGITLP